VLQRFALRSVLALCGSLAAVEWTMPTRPALALTDCWDGTGTGGNVASACSTVNNATPPDPANPPGATNVADFSITTVNSVQTVNFNANQAAHGPVFSSTGPVMIQAGAGSNTLTLSADGITIDNGVGTDTTSTPVSFNGVQSWDINSASPLPV